MLDVVEYKYYPMTVWDRVGYLLKSLIYFGTAIGIFLTLHGFWWTAAGIALTYFAWDFFDKAFHARAIRRLVKK